MGQYLAVVLESTQQTSSGVESLFRAHPFIRIIIRGFQVKNLSTLKCLVVTICSLLAAASQAQNYPQNPIKIIVPYSVGGPI